MLEVRSISLLFALALVYPLCSADPLTCYYPDGSIAESDVACNADAVNGTENASACCLGYGEAYCTFNGLCNYRGGLTRASCTDRTWKSLKCPRQCTNANANTFMKLFPCQAVGSFQCEWNDCSDNFTLVPSDLAIVLRDSQAPDGVNAVAFANPNNQFAALNDTTSTTTLVVGGSNRAAETAASPEATASSGTQSASSQSAAETAATPKPNASPGRQSASSQSASATAAAADGSKSSSTNLPLALGLAIPLGVLLIAALAAVFYYRRRASKNPTPLHSNHKSQAELSSDWPSSPKPKSGWQSDGPHYSSGSATLASPSTNEMPDRGPLPELKGPGNAAHELSTSGRNSMPMRNY